MNEPAEQPLPETERPVAPTPRIYVASLSDYNAGRLHGTWMDADQDVEALYENVSTMLAASPEPGAEEWAIHDYQGFGAAELSEYESLETVVALARGITEHGPAFAAWAALTGLSSLTALDVREFENAYRGHWPSIADYAEELLDDLGARDALQRIPDWLQPYVEVDIRRFGRDLTLGGDIRTVEGEGGMWIFGSES